MPSEKVSRRGAALLGRRSLLTTAGVALALPFMPSLLRSSAAAAPAQPKRFIHLFTSNGQRPQNWYPSAAQDWKVLSASGSNYAREAPLSGPDAISLVLGSEFAPLKSKLLLVRGLDFIQRAKDGHQVGATLSGFFDERHVSIDQVMAYSSKVYPSAPPIGAPRSLQLLIRGAQAATSVSTTKEGTIIDHQVSPAATFDTLFKSLAETDQQDAAIEAKRSALELRVVDQVKGQYDALRNNPRLGSEDRQRLEAHASYIRDLEARLMSTAGAASCMKPTRPTDPGLDDSNALPELTTTNIDLLVAAIRCDRTRVATLMLCPGTDLRSFTYLPDGPIGEHHGISHEVYSPGKEVADGQLARINNWYAKQVADLLTKLDVIEDPVTGSTYLDNSIVYWGNEDGCNNGDAHQHMGMPVLLAGSAGGYFKTGRYLDYRNIDANGKGAAVRYPYDGQPSDYPPDRELRGRAYNSLLITLMEAMGLGPEDYQAPGQLGFGNYSDNYEDQYSLADARTVLPYI